MKTVFYRKVGRRYQPVSEYDSELIDAFTKGTHLVMSYPGGQSRRYNIDPNYAALIAAGRVAEDAISTAIMEASKLRYQERQRPLTERQIKAWKNLSKEMGVENYALEWPSYREAAEKAVEAMIAEADKLMTHESVRKAYEHFQLVCKLVKDKENV